MNLYAHKVNQLARSFNKETNEKISPLGLYTSQWGIILYLYEKKQCTQVELSQYLSVEAPTITRTLVRMEKMGWVIRQEGKDKRQKNILLTEKAYQIYARCFDYCIDIEDKATEGISKEDLDVFNETLEKMMKNLERG